MTWTSSKLRALSIVAGCVLALISSLAGVDGLCHGLAGMLVGYGVGVGSEALKRFTHDQTLA